MFSNFTNHVSGLKYTSVQKLVESTRIYQVIETLKLTKDTYDYWRLFSYII